jgi:hypothetical protein
MAGTAGFSASRQHLPGKKLDLRDGPQAELAEPAQTFKRKQRGWTECSIMPTREVKDNLQAEKYPGR